MPLHAGHIRSAIRRHVISLRGPEHFTQAFHNLMVRRMRLTEPRAQRFVGGFDAGGLVCLHLLADGHVHR
jgi:alpha-beta hydrolase superfamily lysophospholipase